MKKTTWDNFLPSDTIINRQKEADTEKQTRTTYMITKQILRDLFLLNRGNTKRKHQLRQMVQQPQITLTQLEEIYWMTVDQLNSANKHQHRRTHSELLLQEKLQKFSKRKHFHSFWIENHIVDLFFPRYCIAIEIDGGIHHEEQKQRKDNYKEETLKSLGIPVKRISNYQTERRYYRHIKEVNSYKALNTNSTNRLMRNIYIHTIARHHDLVELQEIFGVDFLTIAQEVYHELV